MEGWLHAGIMQYGLNMWVYTPDCFSGYRHDYVAHLVIPITTTTTSSSTSPSMIELKAETVCISYMHIFIGVYIIIMRGLALYLFVDQGRKIEAEITVSCARTHTH